MKKETVLFCAGAAMLLMASCCRCGDGGKQCGEAEPCRPAPVAEECGKPCPPPSPECQARREKWEKFDQLGEEEQAALLAERKAGFDQMDADRKAREEAFEAAWADFDNKTIAERKALIDQKYAMTRPARAPRCGRPEARSPRPSGCACGECGPGCGQGKPECVCRKAGTEAGK